MFKLKQMYQNITAIIFKNGTVIQMQKAKEELLELSLELARSKRNNNAIKDEVSDCFNMLIQICIIKGFTYQEVIEIMIDKQQKALDK